MRFDIFNRAKHRCHHLKILLNTVLSFNCYLGRHIEGVPDGSIIFFPCRYNLLNCGLTGIVSIKHKKKPETQVDISSLKKVVGEIECNTYDECKQKSLSIETQYLAGKKHLISLYDSVRHFQRSRVFLQLFSNRDLLKELLELSDRIRALIDVESGVLSKHIGHIPPNEAETVSRSLEILKDVHWSLTREIDENIRRTEAFISHKAIETSPFSIKLLRELNVVLNSIDRLEVRGRDSAGISILLIFDPDEWNAFIKMIGDDRLKKEFNNRSSTSILSNGSIQVNAVSDNDKTVRQTTIAFTYKIAAEIGSLGDNVSFLREQIRDDAVFQRAILFSPKNYTISSHTRWASVGAITESNCHPVDNVSDTGMDASRGIIHACLNGDIDNYLELKASLEEDGCIIQEQITTDTKIIPLQIQKYIHSGLSVEDAFRSALNDFKGSHAISMHTDLAPGKFFLAQRGSGQAIFVGLSDDHYMPASEVYGFVEETPYYLKLDGEKIIEGLQGDTQGQIFILDQTSAGGITGIQAMYYDGTPLKLEEADIKRTDITSRDIDRQNFPHYFLKEISESPLSVENTLQNRWKITGKEKELYTTVLDKSVLVETLQDALIHHRIRRIFFVGQGTAGVAAQACADIMSHYLNDPKVVINALKASELSGFKLNEHDGPESMANTLVVAISQSGTTTDTNRTIDMVRERGAKTLAIVNRRDSDITFKVDGVLYTSTGRDIEMSVASTKAFYSQIVAGAILGLHIAALTGRRDARFMSEEIKRLLALPENMKKILEMKDDIRSSAQRLAGTKTYWAAVGSGPNKASADEIRIKLSELCYKTISSDYVEDKKHIDLSSEPLIIICAAGAKDTVIGDIIKDTAIFKAHKATPVVIANEGETRFDPYTEDVFHVPIVKEHLAPIVNTLAGHIWGYYAALAINEGSKFLHKFREEIRETIDRQAEKGLDVYELVLEKSFREKIARFYQEFRAKRMKDRFPISIAMASDLALLLKYLSGKLPIPDFELDFGIKGTALNMINTFFKFMGESINNMSRPIDAIKHQAKTVTVGTSRISEKVKGLLFDSLEEHGIKTAQILPNNVLVIKNLQDIVSGIEGSILYRISGMNLLGELTEETNIEVIEKKGVLKPIPSRVETDTQLKGTKRIIVQKGNVYIGKGRKDDRTILVIPVISATASGSSIIENLLLLNITFKEDVPLPVKTKALGGKYEHIKNIVQENSVPWDDAYLARVDMDELFGRSAEKIGEYIINNVA